MIFKSKGKFTKEFVKEILGIETDKIEITKDSIEYWEPTANHGDGLWLDYDMDHFDKLVKEYYGKESK